MGTLACSNDPVQETKEAIDTCKGPCPPNSRQKCFQFLSFCPPRGSPVFQQPLYRRMCRKLSQCWEHSHLHLQTCLQKAKTSVHYLESQPGKTNRAVPTCPCAFVRLFSVWVSVETSIVVPDPPLGCPVAWSCTKFWSWAPWLTTATGTPVPAAAGSSSCD